MEPTGACGVLWAPMGPYGTLWGPTETPGAQGDLFRHRIFTKKPRKHPAENKTGRIKNPRQKPQEEPGPKAEKRTRAPKGPPKGPYGPQFLFRLLAPILFSAFAKTLIVKIFGHGGPQHVLKAALYVVRTNSGVSFLFSYGGCSFFLRAIPRCLPTAGP